MNRSLLMQLGGALTSVSALYFLAAALFPGPLLLDELFAVVVSAAPAGESMNLFGRAVTGILGAVVVGMGELVRRLGRVLDQPTPEGVRSAVRGGVLTWFIVDSVFSVVIGAAPNLVLNLGVLVLLGGPALLPASPPAARPVA